MDGTPNTVADARRRLNNSADGVASVILYLHTQPQHDNTRDDIEYLTQAERILRRVNIAKGDA